MIQDTAWSPRFVPSTTATAATSGEAIAGTDTTKFITPSLLPAATSYHAGPVVNGRAPRQGLVFDGTAGGDFTLTSAPSGQWSTDQTVLIPTANPSTALGLFSIGGAYSTDAAISMYISGGGALVVEQNTAAPSSYRTASISGFRASYSGKTVRIATTVSSGTLTIYVNGVSVSHSESTSGGSPPAWGATLGSGTSRFGKLTASQYYFNSGLGPLYIYNRALSASEVVALYEAGAPARADYPSSPAGTAVTITTTLGGWTGSVVGTTYTISTASTGFIAAQVVAQGSLPRGRIRVNYDATINSGPGPAFGDGNLFSSSALVAGTGKTVEFNNPTAGNVLFLVNNYAAGNYVVTVNSVTVTGLLLAPDAAQAGNGYVWNDQSGNLAQIVLPSSGVAWNLPSVAGNRIRGTTNTNGNQQLLGASTLLPAECQITYVRARARSGTPTITIGTASGGAQIVASVALSTTWLNCTIALTGGIVSSADDIWVGSNSTDVVETDIAFQPLDF